jgi:hypothetical protein
MKREPSVEKTGYGRSRRAAPASGRLAKLLNSNPRSMRLWLLLALVAGTLGLVASRADGAPAGGGLARIELNSFYERTPISVSPHAPASALPVRLEEARNGSRVTQGLGLGDNAKEALRRNGFVVVPCGRVVDVIAPYDWLPRLSIPNFVTSDSLLHLYHVQFDEILKCVEAGEFLPRLVLMTRALQADALGQYECQGGELQEAARRNVGFYTVALKLLDESATVPGPVANEVNAELSLIAEHGGYADSPVFVYREDYSQYVPRGHYTRSEELKRYFKAMMWYGRMAFLLKGSPSWGPDGEALVSVEDARIQTLQALLVTLALDGLQAEGKPVADIWNRIYGVTAFFVGLADDLTPYEYKVAMQKVFGAAATVAELADPAKLFALKKELALLPNPQIYGGTGRCMLPPNCTAEDLDKVLAKTKGLRFMGQRFIPDSYMFQNLVLPVVRRHTGAGTPFTLVMTQMGPVRGFPRGLDVMAVLGSEAALGILDREGDTDYEDYDLALNSLMALFRSFNEAEWTRNLYWAWLYTLQPLLAGCGEGYPAFMRTAAWQDKQLSTALASWAELRHDTILYAKQSYTGETTSVPDPPDRGYVEPVPEFYNRLLALTRMTRTGLAAMNVLDAAQTSRLALLEDVLGRLQTIAVAELSGGGLTDQDYAYIEGFGQVLAPLTNGLSDAQAAQTAIIADVHTDANTRQVLEEGVGYVKLLVAAYPLADGATVLGAGPVFSYYEFKWPMNDRLTDEKWTNLLASAECPAEPGWVSSFAEPVTLPPEDADGDGLPDAWEVANWGSTGAVNDAQGDADGDGFTNLQEYRAGTDPRDPDSFLRLAAPQAGASTLTLRWSAQPARRYRVFYSDDLVNWYPLQCPVVAAGAMAALLDPAAATAKQRFYRVQTVP